LRGVGGTRPDGCVFSNGVVVGSVGGWGGGGGGRSGGSSFGWHPAIDQVLKFVHGGQFFVLVVGGHCSYFFFSNAVELVWRTLPRAFIVELVWILTGLLSKRWYREGRGGEQKNKTTRFSARTGKRNNNVAGPTPLCEPLFAEVFFQGLEEVWFCVIIFLTYFVEGARWKAGSSDR
jgi:hypothetical protein